MTRKEAIPILDLLAARFHTVGLVYCEAVGAAYLAVLVDYDFEQARLAVIDLLRASKEPPTDADLRRALSRRPANDGGPFTAADMAAMDARRSARDGVEGFEAGFRRSCEEDGRPVPAEWELRFREWREKGITNGQLANALASLGVGAQPIEPDPAPRPVRHEGQVPVTRQTGEPSLPDFLRRVIG